MSAWPLIKRREHLDRHADTASGVTYPVSIRGGRQDFNVFEVPIDLPKYRLENMRTRAAQREHIRKEEVSDDFFADPDSFEVQLVQHEILFTMVHGTAIYEVLSNQDQTDPIILTRDGFVVNGNRRLCAMRTLLEKHPNRAQRYGRVRVIVLPRDFDEPEVRRLEAELQVYPDTKLEYSWVDLALSKRSLRDNGMEENQIAALYKEDVKEVRLQIGSLSLAEKYLKHKDREERYSELPKGEHTFYRLYEGMQKLKGAEERDVLQEMVFALLDNPEGVSRIYTLIPEMVKNMPKVMAAVADAVDVSQLQNADEISDNLDDLLGDAPQALSTGPANLGQAIRLTPTSAREAIRDAIVDAVEDIRSQEKTKKKAELPFEMVKAARAKLQDAVTSYSMDTKADGIERQLLEIETLIARLRERLNARTSG